MYFPAHHARREPTEFPAEFRSTAPYPTRNTPPTKLHSLWNALRNKRREETMAYANQTTPSDDRRGRQAERTRTARERATTRGDTSHITKQRGHPTERR
ncbi:uncharacterized protein HfgLR_25300 (plasmid) [Haloferax gibbonsii]|uniref:Uncharacterized protein n=1 Tax=Haloferax gibbonsii TaxID=35746 RepID=A0A871BN66_HALGI|nr:uncharacterized protein HfgLR_25300 [Haloferax gibbonsii]